VWIRRLTPLNGRVTNEPSGGRYAGWGPYFAPDLAGAIGPCGGWGRCAGLKVRELSQRSFEVSFVQWCGHRFSNGFAGIFRSGSLPDLRLLSCGFGQGATCFGFLRDFL